MEQEDPSSKALYSKHEALMCVFNVFSREIELGWVVGSLNCFIGQPRGRPWCPTSVDEHRNVKGKAGKESIAGSARCTSLHAAKMYAWI